MKLDLTKRKTNPVLDNVAAQFIIPSKQKNIDTSNPWKMAQSYRKYNGKPVNFAKSRLEPWKPILEDRHNKKVICKPRKVTASEQMINDSFWMLLNNRYCDVAMAFPRQMTIANKFSKSRVMPAIRDSHFFKSSLRANEVELKSFSFYPNAEDEQFLYIYGVVTPGEPPGDKFRSTALRATYYDEVQMIPYEAHSTIDSGKKPDQPYMKWCSGTHTTPGNVLNTTFWLNSDQRLMLFKCPSCNTWQFPTIKDNLFYKPYNINGKLHPEFRYPLDNLNRKDEAYLGCVKCQKSIEHLRGRYGNFGIHGMTQYVAQSGINEYREYRGYFVDKLTLGLVTIESILDELSSPTMTTRKKKNEVIGLPHTGDDSPFSMQAMSHCLMRELDFNDFLPEMFDYISVSIDWGKPSWFSVWGYINEGRFSKMILLDCGHTTIDDEKEHGVELSSIIRKKWGDNITITLCDKGYSIGREKDLFIIAGKERTYTVDANIGNQKDQREHFNVNIKECRKSHNIKAGRDFVLENFEECLDRNETKFFVPYANPDRLFGMYTLKQYLLHYTNVYRMPMSEFRGAHTALTEIKTDKTAYYKDAGSPDHFLMITSYASLLTIEKLKKILLPSRLCVM